MNVNPVLAIALVIGLLALVKWADDVAKAWAEWRRRRFLERYQKAEIRARMEEWVEPHKR